MRMTGGKLLVHRLMGSAILFGIFLGTGFVVPRGFVAAATGVPEILNHQGRLLSSAGNLLGGSGTNYCFQFSLYNSVSGGSKVWPTASPSTMTVNVVNGVFSVGIGDVSAGGDVLTYDFASSDTTYLNIDVAAQVSGSCAGASFETLSPRQRVFAAGYALNSNTVGGFAPSQEPSGSNIPVLNSGNLTLSGTNPQVNAAGANALVLQGGGGTGDIQFFSGLNTLTSAGALTVAGTVTAAGLSIAAGTISLPAGQIDNVELANSSISVTAGFGLIDGGSAALGGSTTLNIASANGAIVANADDIALTVAPTADALSSTTSSGSGLEVLSSGLALLQGCANNEILKWNEVTDAWTCAPDSSGGGSGTLDDAYNNGTSVIVDAANILLSLSDAVDDYKLVIDNATNGTIDTAFAITTTGGVSSAVGTAIDVSDADIGTAFALGSNDVTVGGVTISSTEFAHLDGADAQVLDANDTAATATALAANPSDCGANAFATTIAANGNLTCASVSDADVPNNITVDLATLASSVTNATLTTALTVNTGTVTLVGNAANTSSLALGAGASTFSGTSSGTNTGDQTSVTGNAGTVTFADAGGDTTTFLALGTSATGSLAPATDAGLTYNATTNALSTTTFIGALSGDVTGNLTGDVTGNVSGSSGSTTGNAATATALAANPSDCGANAFATTIAANGNLTCASISDADVPNNITVDLATLASSVTNATLTTALTVNTGTVTLVGNVANTSSLTLGAGASSLSGSSSGTNTGDQTSVTGNAGTVTFADAGGDTTTFLALGTSATGSLSPATDAGLTYNATTNALSTTTFIGALTGDVTGNLTGNVTGNVSGSSGSTTGNAATATALAANPSDCGANAFATTIAANGNLTCASISDADVPNNITVDLATLASSVTNATLTTALTVNTGTVTLVGNAANTSSLTLGAGASTFSGTSSGTNTGDQTSVTGNAGTVTFADAGGDTTTFLALGTDATGSLAPTTDAGLTYNATTNALSATTFIGALTGNVTGDLTGNVTGNVSGSSGSTTGNAATATALAANPTDCGANAFATTIAANGNLTCASISDADVPNTITVDLATLASSVTNATLTTALTVNTGTVTLVGNAANTSSLTLGAGASSLSGSSSGTNTGDQTSVTGNAGTVTFADAGGDTTTFLALGTAATGSLAPATDAGLTYNATTNALSTTTFIGALTGDVTGNLTGNVTGNVSGSSGSTTGNAATATALAANPSDCGANAFATTIAANGNLTCASISDADIPNNITVDLATLASSVTNATLTTALTVNTGTVTLVGNAANTSSLTLGAGASTFSGTSSGTNTGDQTSVTGNAGTVTGLTITSGKTLTSTNTITLGGTDGSTLNIGTGGTLGSAAYTNSNAYLTSANSLSDLTAPTADLSAGSHKITNVSNGSNPADAVNYAQLAAITGGILPQDPVATPNVIDDSLSTPPGSPVNGEAYLVGASGAGSWTGLSGHLMQWDSNLASWIDVLGRAVIVGDRFGLTLEHGTVAGGFAGKNDYLAQVTSATPGSYTYTFIAPANQYTVAISGVYSPDKGHGYYYNGVSVAWVEYITGENVIAGNGLLDVSSIFSVDTSVVVTLSDSQSLLNKTYNGLTITNNGTNTLSIAAGKTLTVSNDASVSGTNTGDQTSVTGNAGTVTFADAAGDTTTFLALGTSATGSLAPATDAGLTYNATTNALSTTTFIGALTGDVTGNVSGSSGSTTGNAATATALAANPADCGANAFATTIAANGNLTCASISDADIPNNITVDLATLASSVTNATLTTALTVNTGTVTLVGNVANTSSLTLGAGASSLSGSSSGTNTGDQTSVTGNAGTVTFADAGGDTTTFLALGTAATGSLAPATDAGLTYNATTDVFGATGGVLSNVFDRAEAGALTFGATNATSITLGGASVTALTVTTDGTGTAEVALPAGSIDGTEILNDTVALTTDTSGDYVASFTAGAGLTGSGSGEGSTPTIAVVSGNGALVANADDVTFTLTASANGLSATTSSGSGLEVLASGATLLQGCADTQILKWNETLDVWACAADVAGGGGGATTALDNLASVAINTSLISDTDNTDALGSALIGWSDLFLGSGAVIDFNNGDVTATHSANALTFAGGTIVLGTATATGGLTGDVTGNLTGNVTGNVSGSSGSTTGNAGTVTFADAAGDTTTFLALGTSATGSLAPATDAGLTYNATTNALSTTTFIGALSGDVTGNLTGDVTGNVSGSSGSTTGNAATATALAANPSDCGANAFATTIAANGNLTCASISDADVPNNITVDLATLASSVTNATLTTALTVNTGTVTLVGNVANTSSLTLGAGASSLSGSSSGTNTGDQTSVSGNAGTVTFADAAGDTTTFLALGTDATGSLAPATDAGLTYNATTNALSATTFIGALTGDVAGNLTGNVTGNVSGSSGSTTGNAATATALAANPTDCGANAFATTIAANGDLTCASIADADVPNNITVDLATLASSVTNATLTTALTVNTGTVTLTGDVANTSVLTLGAGASSLSGSSSGTNTGDQTSVSGNAGTVTFADAGGDTTTFLALGTSATGSLAPATDAGLTYNATTDALGLSGDLTVSGGDVIGANGDQIDIAEAVDSTFTFTINTDATAIITSADGVNANTPLTINTAGTGALTLDTGTGGAIILGNTAVSASICNSVTCDAITIGNNADADTITIGDVGNDTVTLNGTTVGIDTADWDITTVGVVTGLNQLSLAFPAPVNATNGITVTNTASANSYDLFDMAITGGNADAGGDTVNGFNITAGAPAEATDAVKALVITNSATTNGSSFGIELNGGGGGSTNEWGLIVGAGWDKDLYFTDTSVIVNIGNGGNLTFEDDVGNDMFVLADTSTANNHVLTGDGDTGLSLSGMTSDLSTPGAEALTVAPGGNFVVSLGAAGSSTVTSNAAASADAMAITLTGTADVASVDGLSISATATNQTDRTVNALNISLAAGGTASGDIARGIFLDLASVGNASNTTKAIEIENTTAWDTDLELQNDETIDNAVDGVIAINATTTDVSGELKAGSSDVTLTLSTGFIDADALTLIAAADAGSGTTSGSGLVVRADGIGLLQGCSDSQVLKWVEATDTWDCAVDASGGGISDGTYADITVSGSGTALSVNFTTADGAGAISSAGGLEQGTAGIGLIQGCADTQILKWNDVGNTWDCASDSTSGTSTLQGVYDGDGNGSDSIITLSTADDSFIITNPSSSGTDSAFTVQIDQSNTTASATILDLVQASNAANGVNLTANSIDTEIGLAITANGLTTGEGLNVASSSAGLTDALVKFAMSGSNASNTGAVLRLDNTGTDSANTGLYIDHRATGTGNLAVRIDDVSGDTTPFIIDGDGRVGIGTTSISANAATERLLQVGSESNRGNLTAYGEVLSKGLDRHTALTNIKDIYVYDTTSDSDGGRWVDWATTDNLSWYSESLDDGSADDCVLASDDRCYKRSFPRKAILVVTTDALYIFDAATNDMWMKFSQNDSGYGLGADTNNNPTSVTALNGVIYVGTTGGASGGLYSFDFVNDRMWNYNATQRAAADVGIGARNGAVTYGTDVNAKLQLDPVGTSAEWMNVNDVSAVVMSRSMSATTALGGATNTNPAYGKVFVALATDSGVTLINTTDRVLHQYSDVTADDYTAVALSTKGFLYALNTTQDQLERWDTVDTDKASEVNGTFTRKWDETVGTGPALATTAFNIIAGMPDNLEIAERASLNLDSEDIIYVGHSLGLAELHDHTTQAFGWVKYFNATRETPMMYLAGINDVVLPFDDVAGSTEAQDLTLTDTDMEINGSPTLGVDGVQGKAINFDNTNDYLCSNANASADAVCDVDTAFNMSTVGWTFSLWFKHSATAPVASIDTLFEKCVTAAPAAAVGCVIVYMNTSGNIVVANDATTTWTRPDGGGAATYDVTATSTYAYNDNQWHQLVVTRTNANDVDSWIDGQGMSLSTATGQTATFDNNQIVTIGASCSTTVGAACAAANALNFWDGQIDDFQFVVGTTTQATMTQLYVRRLYNAERPRASKKTISVDNATSATSTSLADTGEAWSANEFAGQIVEITGSDDADCIGITRRVSSNTATSMTFTPSVPGTCTLDTSADFQVDPEALYGASSAVAGIGITAESPLGEARQMCVGTNSGTDTGGITCYNHQAGPSLVADVYHTQASQTDDNGTDWIDDDIRAVDLSTRTLIMASEGHFTSVTEDVRLGQGLDYVSNQLFNIRQEIVLDLITAAGSTGAEVGFTGGADLAEYYYANDALEPGDVVAIDPSQPAGITMSGSRYQTNLLGVVSTAPGIILGPEAENAYPIALAGRVPVKITNENGPIHVGDLLTSSNRAGYAMRATSAGATIGRVLNEPDEMVACGTELPNLADAISEEGPGVTVDESGAVIVQEDQAIEAQPVVESIPAALDDGMCGYAMVFVGLSETHGANVLELAQAYATSFQPVDEAYVAQNEDGLTSVAALSESIIQQSSIMTFLRSVKEQRVASGLPFQNLFTDRVAAAVDILSPLVIADEVNVDMLRGASSANVTVGIGTEGTFMIEGEGTEGVQSLMRVDADGNAFFAGSITASSITISDENATTEATEPVNLASINDAIAFLTASVDLLTRSLQSTTDSFVVRDSAVVERFTTLEAMFADHSTALTDITNRVSALEAPESVSQNGFDLEGNFSVSGIATFGGALYTNALGSIGDLLSFLGDVRFIGIPYFNTDTAGFAVIHEGDTSVDVPFTTAYRNQPIVQANVSFELPAEDSSRTTEETATLMARLIDAQTTYLTSNTRYVVTNKSVNGFTIVLSAPAATDLPFSWTAFAVQDARTLESTTNRVAPESVPAISAPAAFEDPAPSEGGSDSPVEPPVIDTVDVIVPLEELEPVGTSETPVSTPAPAPEVLDVPVEAVQEVAPEPSPVASEPSPAVDTAPVEG